MPAGTIALTNNSASVTGTGTAFASELNANDFIVVTVGGETYTLGVDAVNSGTSLTLLRTFTGPTTTGLAWSVVPAKTMTRITAELAEQSTYSLRLNNIAKINWQRVYSESGDITITLIDGTTFTGPSWKKIVDMLEAVDMDTVQQLADQVSADAQQVAADKAAAADSAAASETSRQAALASSTNANNKATAAANSATAAETAKTAAETARTGAETAKTAAETAKTAAEAAAANAEVTKALLRQLILLGEVQWFNGYVNTVPTGWLPASGDVVNRTDYPELWALLQSNVYHVQTEALWRNSGDATKPWAWRSRYSSGDGSTTFRMPDLNGKQTVDTVVSLQHVFLAGQHNDASGMPLGSMLGQAAPNVTGQANFRQGVGGVANLFETSNNAFSKAGVTRASSTLSTQSGAGTAADQLVLNLSLGDATYGRNAAWLYPHSATGLWIIRAKYPF